MDKNRTRTPESRLQCFWIKFEFFENAISKVETRIKFKAELRLNQGYHCQASKVQSTIVKNFKH